MPIPVPGGGGIVDVQNNVCAPLWVVGILNGIKAPINQQTVTALELWATAEGSSLWRNNWINTVQTVPGSTPCTTCSQQSIQNYPTVQDGINATVLTINQSSWAAIKAGFQQGTLQAIQNGFNTAWAQNGWSSWMGEGYPYVTSGKQPNAQYSQGCTKNYVAGTTGTGTATLEGSGSTPGKPVGCNSSTNLINGPFGIHLLNQCQAKALKGGILTALGAGVMLIGGALVVVSGLGGKGPLAPVIQPVLGAAEAVVAGGKKLPGVGSRVSSADAAAEAAPRTRRPPAPKPITAEEGLARERGDSFEGPNPPLRSLRSSDLPGGARRPAA